MTGDAQGESALCFPGSGHGRRLSRTIATCGAPVRQRLLGTTPQDEPARSDDYNNLGDPMTQEARFDKLLLSLPDVAKAVNAFSSESAQLRVLEALLSAAGGTPEGETTPARPRPATPEPARGPQAKTKLASGKKDPDPKLIPTLNLRPSGKTALRAFVESKAPATNEELYAVIIYYLEQELQIETITIDHVFTSLKELKRKISTRLRTVLSNSARSKGWIDTSQNSLRTTINGQNLVEHDLPAKTNK